MWRGFRVENAVATYLGTVVRPPRAPPGASSDYIFPEGFCAGTVTACRLKAVCPIPPDVVEASAGINFSRLCM